MNHLRDLLDSLEHNAFVNDTNIPVDAFDRMRDWCFNVGEQAVSFHAGDVYSVAELNIVPELVRLPYPICWFQGDLLIETSSEPEFLVRLGLLITTLYDGTYEGQVWLKCSGIWLLQGRVRGFALEPEKWSTHASSATELSFVELMARCAQSFMSALHCTNVQRQKHEPDTKLQKARARRGKAPLFSYWTLQLDGKTERGEDRGGTHASPRVHLRRGHPRQYMPGKWTWVQAHAVGNRALGMVHKDYSAGPALVAAAR